MKIIGVGCGPDMLTEQAIREISRASLIYGSDRAIELARSYISSDCIIKTIDDYKNLHSVSYDSVILSTGDPMLAGLGYLPGEVIPGHFFTAGCDCTAAYTGFPRYCCCCPWKRPQKRYSGNRRRIETKKDRFPSGRPQI